MPLSDCFRGIYPQLSGEQAFQHYEHVRKRLPSAEFPDKFQTTSGLMEIAGEFDAFIFDAYGVLNVGATPIAKAPECIAALRALGKRVVVLSNGASYDAPANEIKFEGLGFDFSAPEIVSSRNAAERALAEFGDEIVWGAMAKTDYTPDEIPQTTIKLADDPSVYDEVTGFLFLSTLDWNSERQKMLEQSFEKNPRPIIVANPDIVSPRENHFGIEPGYIGHRMIEKFQAQINFHGKPFPSVFDIVEERLADEFSHERICMIGDTLHTDILGGAARGWKTILVSDHGMFKGLDAAEYVARSGIIPNWIMPTI